MRVTKDEVLYLTDRTNRRILRFSPDELKPSVVLALPAWTSGGFGMSVTEDGKIYLDYYAGHLRRKKLVALHPGDTELIEVLNSVSFHHLGSALVQGPSLYVSLFNDGRDGRCGIYEYLVPPAFQLER